jgi:hypothetical protein
VERPDYDRSVAGMPEQKRKSFILTLSDFLPFGHAAVGGFVQVSDKATLISLA